MTTQGHVACIAALLLGFGSAAAQQTPETLLDQPFKTFHLMAVAPSQEAALRTAISDLNATLSRQKCAACAYHALRMIDGSQSRYNYVVYAEWPSRSEYTLVHDSVAFASAYARNPVFAALEAKQSYGRFMETK